MTTSGGVNGTRAQSVALHFSLNFLSVPRSVDWTLFVEGVTRDGIPPAVDSAAPFPPVLSVASASTSKEKLVS